MADSGLAFGDEDLPTGLHRVNVCTSAGCVRVYSRSRSPSVLFIHPGNLDSRFWRKQFSLGALHNAAFIDLLGCGESDNPTLSSVTHQQIILEVIEQFCASTVTIVTAFNSFAVAMEIAEYFPEKVRAIVGECPLAPRQNASDEMIRALVPILRAQAHGNIHLAAQCYVDTFLIPSGETLTKKERQSLVEMCEGNFERQASYRPLRPHLSINSTVTFEGRPGPMCLLLVGVHQLSSFNETEARLAQVFTHTEIMRFEAAVNFPSLDCPEEFNLALARFLELNALA